MITIVSIGIGINCLWRGGWSKTARSMNTFFGLRILRVWHTSPNHTVRKGYITILQLREGILLTDKYKRKILTDAIDAIKYALLQSRAGRQIDEEKLIGALEKVQTVRNDWERED
jgi:hypothetical protein